MRSIREFIHNKSSEVEYYSFDDRPGKIFSGQEDCRSTIVVVKAGTGVSKVTTSKYHRWHTVDRPALLQDLKTITWILNDKSSIIPKIGTKTELKIINKLKKKANCKTISNFIVNDINNSRVWYHNAPRYWIHSHTDEYLPKVEYFYKYEKNDKTGEIVPKDFREIKASAQYKSIVVLPEHSDMLSILLNSSLFYWWYVIWSDGRHLLSSHIESFPLELSSSIQEIGTLSNIVNELMESYEKNSNTRVNVRDDGKYCIRIKEICPKRSKVILDRIDDILAEHLGFNAEEKDFIKNFDIKFRFEEE